VIFKHPVGIWTAKAEPTADELRSVWRTQDFLTTRLEFQFRGRVQSILNKYARAAADAAENFGQNFSLETAISGIQGDLLKEFERQYRRTIETFGKDFFDGLNKSHKIIQTKDQSGIFEGLLVRYINSNAAKKVQQVTETTRRIIKGAIAHAVDRNLGPEGMARTIIVRAGGAASANRAATIARTETHNAAQFGQQAASEATGLRFRKYWVAADDERTRPDHDEADRDSRANMVFNEQPFNVGGESLMYPGDPSGSAEQIINCFVPETEINSADVLNASKIPYSGDVFEIKTLAGRVLTISPNHGVLTTDGFVRARELTKFHNLLCQKPVANVSVGPIRYDEQRKPPTIGEIFSSLSDLFSSRSPRGIRVDFNGDEMFFNGDIEVILEDGLLHDVIDPDIIKKIRELALKVSDNLQGMLLCNSLPDELLIRGFGALSGRVGLFNLPFNSSATSLFNSLPFLFFRFGLATSLNSVFAKNSRYYTSITPKNFANSVLRCSSLIELDNIDSINVRSFCGHVYDLHTVSGYIIAQNVVVANCRCGVARRPIIED